MNEQNNPILEVKNLRVSYHTYAGEVKAVRGVQFSLEKGQALAIVGESGCGKSVTAKSIMGLIKAPQGEIKENSEILYHGENILKYNKKQWQHYKGGECAIIFQDALASLNPTMRVGKQIMENLMGHKNMTKQEAAKEAVEMLRMVGIPEPEKRVRQYPHEFSGGMRQRVMIAIAFACDPKILICDEPTTALDVTIQGQILDIIKNLQKKNQTSVIMITHDLGVVANIAQKIAVMYSGIIVESGTCEDIFYRPRHPYTWALIRSVPRLDLKNKQELATIPGTPPDLLNPPVGCPFCTRCSYCMPEKRISDVHFFPMNQVLRCVESAVSLGITHFRLTGGEPLCYPKIEELLCKIKQIKGVDSVHLTTNGVLLKEKAAQLKQAGIDSINVSLDTPNEKEYRVLTGGGKLSNVLDGIRKAAELEIPVKINAVLREQTDVCALAAFAEQNHVTLRFIEMMPIGFGKILPVDPKSKVLETLQERYGRYERIMQRKRKADSQEKYGYGPAVYYRFSDLDISIGLIQAIHGKFCDRCNRVRITSEAKLKPCLASAKVIDLRPALEDTENPDKLAELMRQAIFQKPKSHHFEEQNFITEQKNMSQIGG